MKENGVAKTLQIIGWVELICGFVVAIAADVDEILGIDFGVAIMVSSFITCMLFQGFAEIIDLLHKNVKKQESILDYLKDKAAKEDTAPKTVIEDIEANLPEM